MPHALLAHVTVGATRCPPCGVRLVLCLAVIGPGGRDFLLYVLAECMAIEAPCVTNARFGVDVLVVEAQDCGGELGGAAREERASDALRDGLQSSAAAAGDHGTSGGLALHGGDPKFLHRGNH